MASGQSLTRHVANSHAAGFAGIRVPTLSKIYSYGMLVFGHAAASAAAATIRSV